MANREAELARHYTQHEVERRLISIAGHVQGLTKMHSEGASCGALLMQILAVQGALDKVAGILIDEHLDACLDSVREGAGDDCFEESVREIGRLYRLHQIRPARDDLRSQFVEL